MAKYLISARLIVGTLAIFLSAHRTHALDIYVEESERFANLVLTGTVNQGDATRFRQTVLDVARRNKPIMYVKTYSPGGSLYDGIEIGKMVRMLRPTTLAPNLRNDFGDERHCYSDQLGGNFYFNPRTGAGDRRCECASSCFIIWAGGWARRGTVLGVHRMRYSDIAGVDPMEAERRYTKVMAELKAYFQEISIPDAIISRNMATGSDILHYLTAQERSLIPILAPSTYELAVAQCGSTEARQGTGRCLDRIQYQEAVSGISEFQKMHQR